jgi:hypothetical protein
MLWESREGVYVEGSCHVVIQSVGCRVTNYYAMWCNGGRVCDGVEARTLP